MRVFVTGATGFIGSAVVKELIAAGHHVLGLCRSPEKSAALKATGAEIHAGSIEDLASLKAGASLCDGVIHLAFNHDFSRFVQNCEDDRRAITALGETLAGTEKPLLVTSGIGMVMPQPGQPAREDSPTVGADAIPRAASEEAAMALARDGVNVSIVRLPQIHDTEKQGLVTYYVAAAREKGFLAYLGDGRNRWPAAPVADVARLYRLAIEKAERGAIYHAVAEAGVSMHDIAGVLSQRLNLPVKSITPEESQAYFGWLAMFAAHDMPASSEITKAKLGWQPQGPSLLADLAELKLPD